MTDHLTLHRLVADPLNESVRLFDAELESREPFVRELCARISRYRGKMLRPTLLLLTARACGGDMASTGEVGYVLQAAAPEAA